MFRGLLTARQQANWLAVRKILATWFVHVEESFSIKKFSSKRFPTCENQLVSCRKSYNYR